MRSLATTARLRPSLGNDICPQLKEPLLLVRYVDVEHLTKTFPLTVRPGALVSAPAGVYQEVLAYATERAEPTQLSISL